MEAADVRSDSWVASLLLFLGTPTAIIFAIIAGYLLARFLSRSPTTEENMVRVRRPSARNDCPICIDPVRFAVETNCGHIFCANCLIQNWKYNLSTSPMACPFCRQEVTLMLPCFTERETNTAELPEIEERERLLNDVKQYNRMYSEHPRSLYGQLQDLPTILRHIWAELFTWRGIEIMSRFRVIVCLATGILYAIMPVDLIPEAFLGLLGLIDDVIVIAFLLIQVSVVYRTVVANRDW
ncbi:E3 ubiquitin-protein ligase RNF170-like [Macrobrachium rosenbergii]|uniref:E3 ubiquitin-protein ligase RNF170-like n=1 Tax=Macrobrachium rosenbergii TaxID=79674 RepID=UPI0034D45408